MKSLHKHLERHVGWYARWHQSAYSNHVHYGLLVLSLALLIAGIGLCLPGAWAATATGGIKAAHDPFVNLKFEKRMKGKRELAGDEAISALGTGITQVAKYYKKTDYQFKNLFKHDKSARLDKHALVFYAEALPQGATLGDGIISNNPATSSIPDSQTFLLHSNPNASAKIYIDFKGGVITSPNWNGGLAVTALPYSLDADPGFSSQEMTQIKEIWRSVSEDYSPFNVDITTEQPLSADQNHYTRVVVTPTSSWFGSSAGGVAYVGSFRWIEPDAADTVAWVFSALLSNVTKNIEEAVSHEAGHTLGLSHVSYYTSGCVFNTTYYPGAGTNPGWSTIMGNSYNKPITQWANTTGNDSLATPYGCTSEQDDIAVMMSVDAGNLSAANDEAGNTTAAATNIKNTVTNGVASVDQLGVLSRGDVDVYRITTAGGTINLTVNPTVGAVADLDFRVRLLNSGLTPIMDVDPAAIASASINLSNASAGTYYLEITSTGYLSSQLNAGGYTSNGSLGRYNILGTYPATLMNGPDTTAPIVSITSPLNGSLALSLLSISATASDDVGVTKVEFYNGATLLGTSTIAPYNLIWDTTSVVNGSYKLTAKAYDAAGNIGTFTTTFNIDNPVVDKTAPIVSWGSPSNGTSVVKTITLSANASDDVGVTKVEFYNGVILLATDTTAPYTGSWDTTSVATGTYVLTAKAYDAAGNTAVSTGISVKVSNTLPDSISPTISLTAPTNGATISGVATLSATASDNLAVTKVEFYNGNTLLGSDTSSPYSITWDTKSVANNMYGISARAYDAAGNVTNTSAISVTVNNGSKIIDTIAPVVSTILYTKQTSTIILTGNASDNINVVKMEMLIDGSIVASNTKLFVLSYKWNTKKVKAGSHTIVVRAYDAAGNMGTNSIVISK